MKLIVNDTAYPLRGWMPESAYEIVGYLTPNYYLCKDKDGNEFALYLPNVNKLYPRIF